MQVYINKMSDGPTDPLHMALTTVAKMQHSVVAAADQADLIVVASARDALGYLKDYENATVLVALAPWSRNAEEPAVKSLAVTYPGRVVARPMLEREGEENVVFFIQKFTKEAT